MVRLEAIRYVLAEAGLAIVPAADVPSAEERKVLEACEKLTVFTMRSHEGANAKTWPAVASSGLRELAVALVALRAAKEQP